MTRWLPPAAPLVPRVPLVSLVPRVVRAPLVPVVAPVALSLVAFVASVSLTLAALPAAAAAAESASAPQTYAEIEECVRANLPETTSVQTVRLRAEDRTGAVSESHAKVYWQRGEDDRSRVMMRLSDPPDMRGSALLMIEREDAYPDMLMYLPELRRVRRVTGRMLSGSLFGTDFSYEDFARIQGIAESAGGRRLDDAEVAGRPVFVIENQPDRDRDGPTEGQTERSSEGPGEGSATERVVSYVDRATCVPLRVEIYEGGGAPARVLSADPASIAEHGERSLPHRLVMRDEEEGTETELVVDEIELDVEIPRKIFSQRELERGN